MIKYVVEWIAGLGLSWWDLAPILISAAITFWLLRALWRGVKGLLTRGSLSDRLTILGALLAQGVSAQGMWLFFGDVLKIDPLPRFFLFAFIEVAALASALRGQETMRRTSEEYKNGISDRKPSAGIDGIAVWVLAAASGVFSALDAAEFAGALFRLAAPLIAAWLWERSLATSSAHITGRKRSRINWRLSPERLLVRVGLADPTDRSASEVSAQHHLMQLAITATRARALIISANGERLPLTGRGSGKRRRALTRFHNAHERAIVYAALTTDADRKHMFLADLDALITRDDLLTRQPATAWSGQPDHQQAVPNKPVNELPPPPAPPAPPKPPRQPHRRTAKGKGIPADARSWFSNQLAAGTVPAPKDLVAKFGVSAATSRRWHGLLRSTPEHAARIAQLKGVSSPSAHSPSAQQASGHERSPAHEAEHEHASAHGQPADQASARGELAEQEADEVIAVPAQGNGHHPAEDVTEPYATTATGSSN
ncbi:hypothetical protein [Nonomuraea glycinis]|uniref:hypothetical protein n=1 Tax=Nonomuraea glycinis TaxID=2047744 RepID=UPI0033B2DABA